MGNVKLSLLTPTGGRPIAFALCERWMKRQIFEDLEWIVVDDCNPATECTMGQTVIRPKPFWQPGQNTQSRSLIAGLKACKGELVAIIEDDDWYSPAYLKTLVSWFDSKIVLAGEAPAWYYHVKEHSYKDMGNKQHASLCATGFRQEMISTLTHICEENIAWLDIHLWQEVQPAERTLTPGHLVVGVKGLPGRPGVSDLHRGPYNWAPDPDGSVLRKRIGQDADAYRI